MTIVWIRSSLLRGERGEWCCNDGESNQDYFEIYNEGEKEEDILIKKEREGEKEEEMLTKKEVEAEKAENENKFNNFVVF